MTQAEQMAATMTMQGFTFRPARTSGFYWVERPDGEKFLVSSFSNYCDCAEAQEGKICAHKLWLNDELAWQASAEARCEDYDLAQLDGVAV